MMSPDWMPALAETVRLGFGDESALRLFEIEPLGDFGADRLNAHAEPASHHLSLVPQVGHHGAHGLGGNGKADTDRTSRRRHDRAVDIDDLAGDVEGRASRVALVDRRIDLDEFTI